MVGERIGIKNELQQILNTFVMKTKAEVKKPVKHTTKKAEKVSDESFEGLKEQIHQHNADIEVMGIIDIDGQAKNITERAKQSDQFEYDDPATARQIFDKLPAGEFVIKEGNRTVIQKL